MKSINSWDKTFILTISKYMKYDAEINIKNNAYSFLLTKP